MNSDKSAMGLPIEDKCATFDRLLGEMKDKDYAARLSVMRSLAMTDTVRAVEPLLLRLRQSVLYPAPATGGPDPREVDRYEREVAAELLLNLDERRACDALATIATDPTDPFWAIAAVSLGKTGDKRAIVPLLELIRQEYSYPVAQAVLVLGDLGDEVAVEPLLQAMIGKRKYDFVVALGKIGDNRAAGPLFELLQTDTYACHQTVRALGKVNATPELIACLRHHNSEVRRCAAQTLGGPGVYGELRDSVISGLEAALQDEISYVRSTARKALRNLGVKVPRNYRQRFSAAKS